jgi:arylsulfatase
VAGRLGRTQPGIFSVDDLADVGVDLGTPVADYGDSSRFTGAIESVTIEVRK